MKKLLQYLCILIPILSTTALSPHPLLLIVVFDGFRNLFLSEELTPNLWKIAEDGVRLEKGARPQLSPVTAPSHYCIATGLYQEVHGIVGNEFYDPTLKKKFIYWPEGWNSSTFNVSTYRRKLSDFYKHEPIWLSNEAKEEETPRFSGAMYFPNTDVPINGKLPKVLRVQESCCDDRDNLTAWKSEFQEVIGWFTRKTDPINFGLFYVAQPDHVEHMYGTQDPGTKNVIKAIDQLVKFMKSQLEDVGLWDRMNIIFTADHGFVDVNYTKDVIPMKDFLKEKNLEKEADWSCGGRCLIFHNKSIPPLHIDSFKREFEGKVTVILKNSPEGKKVLKEKYHYFDNERIGDVIFIEEKQYFMDSNFTKETLKAYPNQMRGQHHFAPDRPEMNALLMFHGPDFKNGFILSSEVENIDLYPLMAHILAIQPKPNNGSLSRIWPVLAPKDGKLISFVYSLLSSRSAPKMIIVFGVVVPSTMFLCYLLVCFAASKQRREGPGRYSKLEETPNGNHRGRTPLLELGDNVDSMSEDEL